MTKTLGVVAILLLSLSAHAQQTSAEVHYEAPPSKGTGLIIAGSIVTGVGLLNLATSPICLIRDLYPDKDIRTVCLGLSLGAGGVMVAVGTPMLIVGLVRRGHYHEWRQRNRITSWLMEHTSPVVSSRGAGALLSGEF